MVLGNLSWRLPCLLVLLLLSEGSHTDVEGYDEGAASGSRSRQVQSG
jgi:hypothetical protein